jgi:dihydroneopterin aldolase
MEADGMSDIAPGQSEPFAMETVWDPSRSYIRSILRNVVTEARVGLHPWEQHPERPSRLVVNVEMFAPLDHLLDAKATMIDYDPVRDALKTWPARPHTPMLETMLNELVELCFSNPRVQACRVSIMKPDIFNEAAGAGVEVYKIRDGRAPAHARK